VAWSRSVRTLPPLETSLGLSDQAPVLKTTRRLIDHFNIAQDYRSNLTVDNRVAAAVVFLSDVNAGEP
jgi:hypothetical protein